MQPDLQALALTKAIRQSESGGNYGAVGDAGTSTGAYQFQPATWKLYAKQVLGNENAEMTPENQNAVVYGKVKMLKDSGMGPAEIAAAWNAGEAKAKDGSWVNNVGVNKINGQDVPYNTPQYVQGVVNNFRQLYPQVQQQFEMAPAQPQERSLGGFISNIGSSTMNLLGGIGAAVSDIPGTLKTLGGTAVGIAEKLIPGEQPQEKYADALGQFIKQRYGTPEAVGNTIYNDPVGFLTDLSSVLSGGGAAITKLGQVSKIADIAKIGTTIGKLDPIVAASKAVDSLVNFKNIKLDNAAVKLEGSSLGWTAGQKAKYGTERINEINKFGAKLENIGDPATRLEVGQAVVENMKARMDFAADQSLVLLPKEQVIKELELLKQDIKARPNYQKALDKKITDAIDGLDSVEGTHLTAGEINSLKKDFDSTINYDSFGRITNEGRASKAVADYFRKAMVREMDAAGETINGLKLAEFNKQFGIASEYLKQLVKAQGKGGPGLLGKGFGSFVGNKLGEIVGGAPGEIVGTFAGEKIAEKVGGVKAKSYLGSKLVNKEKVPSKTKSAIKNTLKKTVKPGFYSQEIQKNL